MLHLIPEAPDPGRAEEGGRAGSFLLSCSWTGTGCLFSDLALGPLPLSSWDATWGESSQLKELNQLMVACHLREAKPNPNLNLTVQCQEPM